MDVRHLTSIRDLTAPDVAEVFRLATDVKSAPGNYRDALSGRTLALLLDTPSTRTRLSFHIGMFQMGGQAVQLRAGELELGRGETLADTARALSCYVDGIVARVGAHAELVELSKFASVPVINGLTDLLDPCQALADYFTLAERLGGLKGRKIAYIGEGSSMCHSLLYGANKVGMNIAVATPAGLEPKSIIVKSATREAKTAGVSVEITQDPAEAVADADAVYTDSWKATEETTLRSLEPFRVSAELMSKAKADALIMHALPARRGREVTADVIDGPKSLVWLQAENRLHVQKALLYLLLRSP